MYKFAGKVIDISDDVAMSSLTKDLRDKTFPDELKKLTVLSPDELEVLPDNDFALIFVDKDGDIYRKFPMPDLDNALVSSLYLAKSFNDLPSDAAAMAANNLLNVVRRAENKYSYSVLGKIETPLIDIASMGKTQGNVYRQPRSSKEDELRKEHRDMVKKEKTARVSLKDSDYALVATNGDVTHRLFPINTPELMHKAAAYFDNNYKLLTPEQRNMFAKSLRDKSLETGVKIASDNLPKYASCNWSPLVGAAIESRIEVLKGRATLTVTKTAGVTNVNFTRELDEVQAISALRELKKVANKINIDKFASLLHNIDRAVDLDKHYGTMVTDAYESTYDGKIASFGGKGHDLASISTMFAGIPLTANQLKSLDIGDLGGLLDENTYTELLKDPIAVFDSLPIPYKSAIVDAIKGPKK